MQVHKELQMRRDLVSWDTQNLASAQKAAVSFKIHTLPGIHVHVHVHAYTCMWYTLIDLLYVHNYALFTYPMPPGDLKLNVRLRSYRSLGLLTFYVKITYFRQVYVRTYKQYQTHSELGT